MIDPNDPHLVGLYTDTGKRGPAIELSDGTRFHILDPDIDVIRPELIAASLSKLCRFTGHCAAFYSVAQHSVMVSRIVPDELAMQGLLHDASEAFIGDLSRPLKVVFDSLSPGLVAGIEDRIHKAIAERFGTGFPHDPAVKVADNIALATEKRDIMAKSTPQWFNLPDPLPTPIHPLGPRGAYTDWMRRYEEIDARTPT